MLLRVLERKGHEVFQKLLEECQQSLHPLQVQWMQVELELELVLLVGVMLLLQAVSVQLAD